MNEAAWKATALDQTWQGQGSRIAAVVAREALITAVTLGIGSGLSTARAGSTALRGGRFFNLGRSGLSQGVAGAALNSNRARQGLQAANWGLRGYEGYRAYESGAAGVQAYREGEYGMAALNFGLAGLGVVGFAGGGYGGIRGVAGQPTRRVAQAVGSYADDVAVRGYFLLTKRGQWRSYYESFTPRTAKLRFSIAGGRQLNRVANSEGAARFGEFASVQRPASPGEAILKTALHPAVTTNNRARYLYQVATRRGFYVEGIVAPQSSFPGGFTQIFQSQRKQYWLFGQTVSPWRSVDYLGY